MPDQAGRPHTLADHAPGDWEAHDHGPDADHDHDDIDPGPLEDNPIWLRDNVELTTVGIDVGSAGTQVIFSRLHLQRRGTDLTSRYVIVDRRTEFESEVAFTPYLDAHRIDGAALGAIIDRAYAQAGVRPGDIDAGVVILTGEALRRENAEDIARILAEKGGDFVTATAGNHMEAMLAAYGSGAARRSHDTGGRILSMDIGGGTTKLAVIDAGRVVWTAALHVGARLIVTDGGRVTRLDPSGDFHAHEEGLHLADGAALSDADLDRIGAGMARRLADALSPGGAARHPHLFLTDPPGDLSGVEGVIVSGGVGEYVYGRESRRFGDLGPSLGQELRRLLDAGRFAGPLLPAGACIRATALGASEYSVQLSGQTSLITRASAVLPRRNLQVVKPDLNLAADPSPEVIADAIRRQYAAFDLDPATADAALALDWVLLPDYARVRRLADGIALALAPCINAGHPLHILIDGDIALTLGRILEREVRVGVDMLVIDGIALRNFDYIDLGRIRLPSMTVPVTIKSLLFADAPGGAARRAERVHFRAPAHHQHHHHDHDHAHDHAHDHGHHHRDHHPHVHGAAAPSRVARGSV
jgi:ethanolamine utilization protein EutA